MVEGAKTGLRVAEGGVSSSRRGTIVGPGRELGSWWVEMDEDGEETETTLREGWRAEPAGVAFVNRLHHVQAQPVAVAADSWIRAMKVIDAALRNIGIEVEWGRCPTFQDVDEAEHPHGLGFTIPKTSAGIFERRGFASKEVDRAIRFRTRELHAVLERVIAAGGPLEIARGAELAPMMAPKVRWHEGASSFTYHLYFRPNA